jgi:predicted acetyltransferase
VCFFHHAEYRALIISYDMAFAFCDPRVLECSDFYLVLAGTTPPEPEREIVPAYAFHVKVCGHDEPVGQINLRVGTNEHIQRYAGNLGYKIDPPYRGRRMAERAVRLFRHNRSLTV